MRNLFSKIILFAVVFTMITTMGIIASAYEYPDEGYWANEAIDAAIANGLLRGKEDGKIHSEDYLTRAEMAAIMVRSFGAANKADVSQYADLVPSAWYYDEFSKAVQMRVFEGDGTGNMRPNDYITREEVFTVVARALVLSTTDYSSLDKFYDKADISSWAKGYMSILTAKSYVNGDNLGNVNPKKNVTRAEFAQLMHNIFRNYYSKADTYTGNTDSNSSMINTGDVTFKNVTVDGDLVIGDGDATGTIRLENVDIKGRLLVRGSNRVELVNTTVGEMVVVNNYNTVVHFDNYRDEEVFDDIILNTEATFKEKATTPSTPSGGGGGGGGGGTSTVKIGYETKYYLQDDEDLTKFTLKETKKTEAAAGSTAEATIKDYDGFTFDSDNEKNILSGTVPSKGLVTLSVYYTRNEYDYTVKYYQQNVEDLTKYDEVTGDRYTSKALYDVKVIADKKVYTGFKINTKKTNDSGKITADGKLLLEVYYDREKYDIEFDGNGYTGSISKKNAVYGQKIVSLLPSITREGYILEGWYDGDNKVDENYVISNDVTLKANWIEASAGYKVTYYTQNLDLTTYKEHKSDTYPSVAGTLIDADTELAIEGFVYDGENTENVISGTVPENGILELKVYYKRGTFDYTVTYWSENADDENYTEGDVDTLQGIFGKEVSLSPTAPAGFELNTTKSTLSSTVKADGTTALVVYYDRILCDYEVITYTENVNGTYDDSKQVESAKYGAGVSVVPPAAAAGFKFNSENSVLEGTVPLSGTLTLKIYYDRISYGYTVTTKTQNTDGTTYTTSAPENKTGKYGATVSADYTVPTGFKLNKDDSVLSGVVDNIGNPKLVVVFDREEYEITFDGNGYEGTISPEKALYGQTIETKLPVIERDGYVLDGWYDGDTKVDGAYVLSGNVTLTAKWIAAEAKYKVIYYVQNETLDGYDAYPPQEFPSKTGEEVKADTTKVITGYKFNASNADNVLSGTIPETGTLVLKLYYDRESYNYTVKTYTQKLDGEYDEDINPENGIYGTTVSVTPSAPTGFVLNSTSSTLSGRVEADGSTVLSVYYDRIYYSYKVSTYTEKTDGSYSISTQTGLSAKYEEVVEADYTVPNGFELDNEGSVLSGTVTDGNLELKVQFNRKYYDYTIKTYTENTDGTYAESAKVKQDKFEATVAVQANPGTGFVVNDKKGILSGTVNAQGSLVLEVYYDRIYYSYTIKYYLENENEEYKEQIVPKEDKFGTTVSVTPDTSMIGYVYREDGSVLSGVLEKDNELELIVYYDREKLTITFDAGEGVDNPPVGTAKFAVPYTLPTVSKVDHTFIGWTDGTDTYNGTVKFRENKNLTAVWEYTPGNIDYIVEYYVQNTDLSTYEKTSETKNGKVDTTATETPEEKTGFVVNEAKSVLSGTISREIPLVLKVYYDRKAYTISFDAGDGAVNPSNIIAYHGVKTDLPSVAKNDYTFKNWTDGTNTYTDMGIFEADTVLTAEWEYTPGTVVYTVEYYVQNTDLETYEKTPISKSGKVDTTVTETPEEKTGFVVNEAKSVLSGTISRETPLVLKVYYDREAYTITFDAGVGVTNPENITAYYGVAVDLPSVSKTDYAFRGWSDGIQTLSGAVSFTKNTDLTAVWEEIVQSVTVTFYDLGSKVGSADVEKGSTVTEAQMPDWGYDYKGYVKDSSVSSVYSETYTHIVSYGWWFNTDTGEWEEFTTETVVNKDIDVYLKSNKFSTYVSVPEKPQFNFYTYYEPDTRFADSIKDILYKGAPLTALKESGYWETVRENGKVQKLLDEEDNIMMLSYMVKFSQILGEENVEEFIVDSAKESFGNNTELEEAFVDYINAVVGSGDGEGETEVRGLMLSAFEHTIDSEPELVDELEQLAHDIMEDADAFEDITGYEYDAFTNELREEIIDEIVLKLEIPSTERDEIVEKLVNYLVTPTHKHELEELVHYAMIYLNDHTDERDQVVEDIIEELYRADLDLLVYQLINNEQFAITDRTTFVAEGLKNKILSEYSYETFVASRIPERLSKAFEIYPEEKIIELYDYAMDSLIAQIDAAILIAEGGETAMIDCGVTPVVNIIEDLYVPLYQSFTKIINNKVEDIYYYSENIYLQELVKLLDPTVWVQGQANAKPSEVTGYKIYDLDYYYNLMYKIVVLGDDAILWYYNNVSEEEYVELTDRFADLTVKYANIIGDIADAYVTDGTLPNEKLTPVEEAIMARYPDLVNNLIGKYKDSTFFNKEFVGEDYEKVRDKVYDLFANVNLTTDEYFDKILSLEAIEDLDDKLDRDIYTKVDEDTYILEAKDYMVKFFRELTDA